LRKSPSVSILLFLLFVGSAAASELLVERYEDACIEGDASACANLGNMYEYGRGVETDFDTAMHFNALGCEHNNAIACIQLGKIYRYHLYAEPDPELVDAYREGCSTAMVHGNSDGFSLVWCFRGLVICESGDACDLRPSVAFGPSYPTNPRSQFDYYYIKLGTGDLNSGRTMIPVICDSPSECEDVYEAMSESIYAVEFPDAGPHSISDRLYFRPPVLSYSQIQSDLGQAFHYFERGCELGGFESCNELGEMYLLGVGITSDEVVAVSNFRLACQNGSGSGCNNLAWMQLFERGGLELEFEEADERIPAAVETFSRGCELGNRFACTNYGVLLATRTPQEALSVFLKACNWGEARACSILVGSIESDLSISGPFPAYPELGILNNWSWEEHEEQSTVSVNEQTPALVVYFEHGSFELSERTRTSIAEFSSSRGLAIVDYFVDGYADSLEGGSGLAQVRASQVRDELRANALNAVNGNFQVVTVSAVANVPADFPSANSRAEVRVNSFSQRGRALLAERERILKFGCDNSWFQFCERLYVSYNQGIGVPVDRDAAGRIPAELRQFRD